MIARKQLEEELECYKRQFKRVTHELNVLEKKVPEGAKLRATQHGNVCQYFMRTEKSEKNGKYIRKKDIKLAEVLAQIEYDHNLITILQKTIQRMESLKKGWVENPYIAAEEKMSPGKREVIKIPYITDECFVQKWKSQEYQSLGFAKDYPEYYTRQGLRVRSKSEVIIADILDEAGVHFLYEKPLVLSSGTVHPDFTVLNLKERKEVFWEHFGMMDDMEYRNNAFLKIRQYEASGFYQSDSIIWTFETGRYPINTKDIRKMVEKLKETMGL